MTEHKFLEAILKHATLKEIQIDDTLMLSVDGSLAASACLKIAQQGIVGALEGMKYKRMTLEVIDKYFDGPYCEAINSLLDFKITEIKALMK